MTRIKLSLAVMFAQLASFSSFAGIEQAPPSIPHLDGNAVFVDFKAATYRITYSVAELKARVESEIEFEMPVKGYPLFDLVPKTTSLSVDGRAAAAVELRDPDRQTTLQVVDRSLSAGTHRMKIAHVLDAGVTFQAGQVASAFWMTDLADRGYLEKYLPTNLEFDQYSMRLEVEITGSDVRSHRVFSNGQIETLGQNRFNVAFPDYFTTSSMFFHLVPEGRFVVETYSYPSVDGRSIPVEVYGSGNLQGFVRESKKVLAELEEDYGPFPHPKLVIYGSGSGGMEYAGATMTELWALGHELFHSYHARGMMPASGNAGWMDEAIARWRDNGYPFRSTPGFSPTCMAAHSRWTRRTDMAAYEQGASFMAWLAHRMNRDGRDLQGFLKEYYGLRRYTTVTTELFRSDLEGSWQVDLDQDFTQYLYGGGGSGACDPRTREDDGAAENPYHPTLTEQQLSDLLWPDSARASSSR